MQKTSSESILVSSMINSGDPTVASSYGIRPEHLVGYRDEYSWVLDHYDRYGHMPTQDRLEARFPGFPYSPDEYDPRWPAHEIHEHFSSREAMKAVMKASELLRTDQVREAVEVLNRVTYRDAVTKPRSLLNDPGFFDDYETQDELRVQMPYPTLQALTNGIGPGELWYWAARPMQGKSSFVIDIGCEAAYKGMRVMIVSLEMTKKQCATRLHAAMGRRLGWGKKINALDMLRGSYPRAMYEKLVAEISEAVPGSFDIYDQSDGFASPSTVARLADEYDLVLVDYIGLMRTEEGGRSYEEWRSAAIISNMLKEIALSKNARILSAAQINREGAGGVWRPPKLSQLSQSDALGQDADVVVTMRRYGRGAEVLSVEKNRHGDSQRLFWTLYEPNTGDFTEITRDEADDIRDRDPWDE